MSQGSCSTVARPRHDFRLQRRTSSRGARDTDGPGANLICLLKLPGAPCVLYLRGGFSFAFLTRHIANKKRCTPLKEGRTWDLGRGRRSSNMQITYKANIGGTKS